MIFHQRVLYFPVGKMTHALGPRRGCTKSSMCGCSRWGVNHSRYGHAYPGRNPGAIATSGVDPNPLRFLFTGTPRTWVELQETTRNLAAEVRESARMRDALTDAIRVLTAPQPTINPEWENAEYRAELLFAPNVIYTPEQLRGSGLQWRSNVNYGRTK